MDKLARVQEDINEATDMMRENIEAVVGRGEHLELLVDKSDSFSANARAFQKDTKSLRNAMWWKNCRMILKFVAVLLVVALMIAWSWCGLSFSKCTSKHSPELR